MAKSQKRSNREVRKPKAVKAPVASEPSSLLSKGTLAPAPKKKGRG